MEIADAIPFRYKDFMLWDLGMPSSWREYAAVCDANMVGFTFAQRGEVNRTVQNYTILICIDGNTILKSRSRTVCHLSKNRIYLGFPGQEVNIDWNGSSKHISFIFENCNEAQMGFYKDIQTPLNGITDDFIFRTLNII